MPLPRLEAGGFQYNEVVGDVLQCSPEPQSHEKNTCGLESSEA